MNKKLVCAVVYDTHSVFFLPEKNKLYYSKDQFLKDIKYNNKKDILYSWEFIPDLETRIIKYYCDSNSIFSICPAHLSDGYSESYAKLFSILKSYIISKVSLEDKNIFEYIPENVLSFYLRNKNEILQEYITNNNDDENIKNYDFMYRLEKLTRKISKQEIKVSLVSLYTNHYFDKDIRKKASRIIKKSNKISYNIHKSVTGRLTTNRNSFPILQLDKQIRQIMVPNNDFFLELDYNASEIRVLLGILGRKQPEIDIHEWNKVNIFYDLELDRSECKKRFFAWFYNPTNNDNKYAEILKTIYDKNKIYELYPGDTIITPAGRTLKTDDDHKINYLLQSTSADIVNQKAIELDEFLQANNCESKIAWMMHDSIVIDMSDKDRKYLTDIYKIFGSNLLGDFKYSCHIGSNYGDMKKIF